MYPYLNGIEFPRLKDLGETKPIGSDHGDLLLHREFRVGRDGESMAVKMKLVWVLMEGRKRNNREGSCNFLCRNYSSAIVQNVQNLWKLDT